MVFSSIRFDAQFPVDFLISFLSIRPGSNRTTPEWLKKGGLRFLSVLFYTKSKKKKRT
jgi:hypothetical protein